jgi:hypothetical protein
MDGNGRFVVRPISGSQRSAAIWQDQNKPESAITMCMTENGEAFTLERVMPAGDGYLRRKVMRMGSVWWFPLMPLSTNGR